MTEEDVNAQNSEGEEPPRDDRPEREPLSDEALQDCRDEALDFLEGLLEAMELEGEVDVQVTEERSLACVVDGEDLAILIGRRGQILEATQDLLRTAVQRQAMTRVRVTLDIEGYRERRREVLAELARDKSEAALQDGEAELEYMSAFERKVIHDAVGEIDGVTSFSEGEEPRRRVIIQKED